MAPQIAQDVASRVRFALTQVVLGIDFSRSAVPTHSSPAVVSTEPANSQPSHKGRQHEIQNIPTHLRIVRRETITEAPKIALLLLALAMPAVAQKPTIQLIPFTSFFVPAAAACGFDVLFTPQAGRPNKERLIQFAN